MTAVLGRVWVVVQSDGGRPATAGMELVGWARGAATVVDAIHWGRDAEAVAPTLGAHGVARVLSTGDLGDALPGAAVAAAMAARIGSGDVPVVVLFSPTHDQRDIVGRLSARLDRPVLANAVGLSVADDGGVVTEHELFGGTTVASARSTAGPPHLVVARPRSLAASVAPAVVAGGPAEVVPLPVPDIGRLATAAQVRCRGRVVRRVGPSLDEAPVVVAAGRGLGPTDRFELVEELARLLGGAPAATRAAVDAGWASFTIQVGQTGRTVAPEVYLAFGISGAAQHLIGMRGARTIVAVNTDPDAPLMAIADLAVVGDAARVLTCLVDAVRARRSAG